MPGVCSVCQPEAGERHAGEADAEFLQRRAPRDRLGHAFGEFIEFVVHIFPSHVVVCGCLWFLFVGCAMHFFKVSEGGRNGWDNSSSADR
jgi:hypothetical protein